MNVGVKKRLRHCFGGRADWAARLRGASLVGGRGLGAWLRYVPTGRIVRCLLIKRRVVQAMARRLRVERHGAGALLKFARYLRAVVLLLCAKGVERAFDEGFACRAHHAGKGCDLV